MEQLTATQIFEKHYKEWENHPDRYKTGYDYERTYAEMMQKVEIEVMQHSLGTVPQNKNLKKKYKPVSEK
jgi:hypothetical protein